MLFVKECRAAQNARFCSGGYAMMSKKDRTRQQMEEEMRQLRKVFMTVRLMKADEVQGGKKGSAPCYAQWRRSRPCENCVARQALEKNTRKTRLEYFGQELYEITASCVQVDGQLCVLELTRNSAKINGTVPSGQVLVDGLGVGDVGNVVLRDRKHLSEDGLVIIVATVDSKTGKVLAGPDLVSRGFVYVRENESLMDGAQSIVETALDRCVDEHVRDWNSVKTRVREALSSYIYRRTKRSPMILPILMEV